MFGSRSEPERLADLTGRAERAAVNGRFGRAGRLEEKAESVRQGLEASTGRAWESSGRPVRD